MKPPSDTTVLVWDNGLGLPIAERLSRDCKRVIYFSPWQKERLLAHGVIGDGIPNVERCADPWLLKNEVDVWVFPDCCYAGEQEELRSQGRAVWGSGRTIRLENDRELFLKTLSKVGLELPEFTVVVGITALREFLRDKEDYYMKFSNYRGTFETTHWRNWELDENMLDLWAVDAGAVRELVRFICIKAINTPLEIGGDTFNVRGKWPSLQLFGIESKDKSYLASVRPSDEMPKQIQAVNEAFAPILEKGGYINEWSVEIRVIGESFYFQDPTCRLGLPSTGSQLELWENFADIVCYGAHGELVEPVPTAMFSAELILTTKHKGKLWPTVKIPTELKQWCKLADCCEVNGLRSFPKESDDSADECGWLVSIGDSPKEAVEKMKEHVSLLPDGLSADAAPLAEVLAEIELGEEKGIDFTEKPIPKPSTVIEQT